MGGKPVVKPEVKLVPLAIKAESHAKLLARSIDPKSTRIERNNAQTKLTSAFSASRRSKPMKEAVLSIVLNEKAKTKRPPLKDDNILMEIAWLFVDHVRKCKPGSPQFTSAFEVMKAITDGKDVNEEEIEAIREQKVIIIGDRVEKGSNTLTFRHKKRLAAGTIEQGIEQTVKELPAGTKVTGLEPETPETIDAEVVSQEPAQTGEPEDVQQQ